MTTEEKEGKLKCGVPLKLMEEKKEVMRGDEPKGDDPKLVGGRLPNEEAKDVALEAEVDKGEAVDAIDVPNVVLGVPIYPAAAHEDANGTEMPLLVERGDEAKEKGVAPKPNPFLPTLAAAPRSSLISTDPRR